MRTKKLSFEESLLKLETIVEKMEDETTTLEESVALYKEGIEISLFCTQKLEVIEKDVLVLQKSAEDAFSLAKFEK